MEFNTYDIQKDLDRIMETFDNYGDIYGVKINISFINRDTDQKRNIKYELSSIHNSRSGPRVVAEKVKDVIEVSKK